MKDREFLQWLARRLITVYGESENVDFVHKLKSVAETVPHDQDTNMFDHTAGET